MKKKSSVICRESIEKLNPCRNRIDNYVDHYGDRKFSPKQFMGLKNITHDDKLWVAFRMLDKKVVRKIAGEIAQSVLHLYEDKYPGDNRPRKAVEVALKGKTSRAKSAAAAACAYAADAAARAAACADAAYAAYYAARAAACADAAYAAYYAARAAYYAVRAAWFTRSKQEVLQRKIIMKYWR